MPSALSQYSDEELLRIAGIKRDTSPAKRAISQYSNEELMRIAGIKGRPATVSVTAPVKPVSQVPTRVTAGPYWIKGKPVERVISALTPEIIRAKSKPYWEGLAPIISKGLPTPPGEAISTLKPPGPEVTRKGWAKPVKPTTPGEILTGTVQAVPAAVSGILSFLPKIGMANYQIVADLIKTGDIDWKEVEKAQEKIPTYIPKSEWGKHLTNILSLPYSYPREGVTSLGKTPEQKSALGYLYDVAMAASMAKGAIRTGRGVIETLRPEEIPEGLPPIEKLKPTEAVEEAPTPPILKPEEVPVTRPKPIQPDLIGVREGLEGKIPTEELPETPLEKATKEAEERRFVEERQLGIPTEEAEIISLKEVSDLPYFPEGELADLNSNASKKVFSPEEIEKANNIFNSFKREFKLGVHYFTDIKGRIIPISEKAFITREPIVDIKNRRIFIEVRKSLGDIEEGSYPRYFEIEGLFKKIPTEIPTPPVIPGLPIKEGGMSLKERVALLRRTGQEEAAKKLEAAETVAEAGGKKPYKPTNIINWIKSKGGIDYIKEYWTDELDTAMENQPTLKRAVNKRGGGLTLDELAGMAQAEGWIKEATPQALLDAINKKKLRPDIAESRVEKPPTRGGVTLYSGIPVDAIVKELKDISKKTSEVLDKAKAGYGVPKGAGVKAGIEAMAEHHKALRDAEWVYGSRGDVARMGNLLEQFVPDKERQILIMHAVQQPLKYMKQLTPVEKAFVEAYKVEADKVSRYGIDTGVLEKVNPNYLYQWWIDEKTGQPYNPMFGRLTPTAPQLRQKIYATIEEGIKAGKVPASTNIFTNLSKSAISLTRAAASRKMLKTLKNIEADSNRAMLRSTRSKEAKPLRLVESWSKLKKQGLTDGYTRFSHYALDKPIIYKDAKGIVHQLKGDVGVVNELYPYVNAYFNNPSYGTWSRLNFASKSLYLMSLFHVQSLTWQAFTGGKGLSKLPIYNVIKGLKEIEAGGEDLRGLFRNGLELHGYADIGEMRDNAFNILAKSEKRLPRWAGKVLVATQNFTFNVVHPGIKANVTLGIFHDLVSKHEAKIGRSLTDIEKEPLYREAVNIGDNLFSGEDYRGKLLQSGQWMAKHFYSPEARARWQRWLISPSWQLSHIRTFVEIIKAFTGKSDQAAAYLYRKYFYTAVSMYATANLYNYIMTKYMDDEGKLMVQNDGHNAFSVRAPYNDPDGRKVYFNPWKSIYEIPALLSDPIGRAINKLAPWVHALAEQVNPRNWKEYQGWPGTVKRIEKGIESVSPIPFRTIFEPSKALPSKLVAPLGLPTSKGYSVTELREEIKKAALRGDHERARQLRRELDRQLREGREYRRRRAEERRRKKREKIMELRGGG